MIIIYVLTIVLLIVSFASSSAKTMKALRIALKRFLKIAPSFLVMLILVSIILYLTPEHVFVRMLARENKWLAWISALGLGSISIMPGFIAFPLCGILLEKGAMYMVLSAFSTSLMMVGVVTFPLERTYLGTRLTLARNIVSLLIAAVVAVATGLFFREIL